jgi:DNA-binding transcriptional MerR regulator
MKVSELSERAGVPLPSIKFYIREGLLPVGRPTGKNQAEYSEEHLARLRLIRALRDEAGLGIGAIARALRAADATKDEFVVAAIDALERPAGPPVDEDSQPFAAAKAELLRLAKRRNWKVRAGDNSVRDAARALTVIHRSFGPETASDLVPYAEVAERIAEHEIPSDWAPDAAREAALRYAVLGTVLFEPLLLTLRRMAHVARTRTLSAQRPGATPARATTSPGTAAPRKNRRGPR